MGFYVEKIAILGAGLLGGSLLRALRAGKLCGEIRVHDGDPHTVAEIERLGPEGIHIAHSAAGAVLGADLVVLAVPVERMASLLRECHANLAANRAFHLSKPTIVTDVGSVKGGLCAELDALLKDTARFVGGHPMAGREKSGFAASSPDLFDNATVILTPTPFTDAEALATVYGFWEALGARIEQMSPGEHDRRMAQISHLPHLAAAALASVPDDAALKVAGSGFRDATRIAAGPAGLWTGILSANRTETERTLDTLIGLLQEAKRALAAGNETALHDFLDRANQMRNKLNS